LCGGSSRVLIFSGSPDAVDVCIQCVESSNDAGKLSLTEKAPRAIPRFRSCCTVGSFPHGVAYDPDRIRAQSPSTVVRTRAACREPRTEDWLPARVRPPVPLRAPPSRRTVPRRPAGPVAGHRDRRPGTRSEPWRVPTRAAGRDPTRTCAPPGSSRPAYG
jgi:hypothetical protein